MPAAEFAIEKFPPHRFHLRRWPVTQVEWVSLGSEYDISHIARLWQLVMRFRIESLPEDESLMWQLADKLRGRRSDIVRIEEAVVSIDRRHLKDFRDQIDWLWDHLVDEHGEHRYVWCPDLGDWIRIESEQPPITDLEDARRAIDIITALDDVLVGNVIKLWEDA